MKQKFLTYLLLFILAFFLVATGAVVLAQSSADFNISWHLIDSGSGESNSADFHVSSTMGQNVANGNWVFDPSTDVYLPIITKH